MTHSKLIEYLEYLIDFIERIKNDCEIEDDELILFNNEIKMFHRRIQNDVNIREEYKTTISELTYKLPTARKLAFREKMSIFYDNSQRKAEKRAAMLNELEDRLRNILTVTTEDVFVNKTV